MNLCARACVPVRAHQNGAHRSAAPRKSPRAKSAFPSVRAACDAASSSPLAAGAGGGRERPAVTVGGGVAAGGGGGVAAGGGEAAGAAGLGVCEDGFSCCIDGCWVCVWM
jgi:hypothetical protein